ncbi:MAG: ribbon-helix-helix protein, CopG family [Ruminococcus sp.]|nr:ribbon-helix-helix protein, CopG family [Ruminococcus sp.]MBQ3285693.1 ribbon-helix-helix protein, CopG family [Ruminococcus sp.]
MANKKLVSVRLDPRDVATLEEVARTDGYRDRSEFIRAAVTLMAVLCKEGKYGKVLSFRPRWGDVLDTFDLTYHLEHK